MTKKKPNEALTNDGLLMIESIAITLETCVKGNKDNVNKNDPFSIGKVPQLSLQEYMIRLAGYINIWYKQCGGLETRGVRTILMSIIYITRITNDEYVLCRYNVHRLVMIACMLATKFEEDDCFDNTFWSKVGGVTLKEVNKMESDFCNLIDYRFLVPKESYDTVVTSAQGLIKQYL